MMHCILVPIRFIKNDFSLYKASGNLHLQVHLHTHHNAVIPVEQPVKNLIKLVLIPVPESRVMEDALIMEYRSKNSTIHIGIPEFARLQIRTQLLNQSVIKTKSHPAPPE